MPAKNRFFLIQLVGILFVLSLLQAGPFQQDRSDDITKKYPEIEGVYELQLGQMTIVVQVYFKDGALRHVATGNTESTKWNPVEGSELRFTSGNPEQGMYRLEFLKDEQGRYTRFRIINEAAKIDAIAIKKAELDDTKADPASPEDRLGYFERHYRKSEHRIPMRDGVRLFTQVYSPMDQSELHPIILFRTPYGIPPYGETFTDMTFPSLYFLKENYILVYQDIRGKSMSEGTFQFCGPYKADKKSIADIDESSDAYDTVEWLLKNVPHNNGKVGVWGISYSGSTAAMAALSSHPAILAVSPQAPGADLFLGDDGHHNGALYLAHYINWLYSVGQSRKEPTPDPPPCTEMFTSECISMKTSAQDCAIGRTVVDPLIVRLLAAEAGTPTSNPTLNTAAITMMVSLLLNILNSPFIIIYSILHLNFQKKVRLIYASFPGVSPSSGSS